MLAEEKKQLVVLVTGVDGGNRDDLGYQIVHSFARTGVCHVYVGAHSPVKTAQAVEALTGDAEAPVDASCLSPVTIDLTSDMAINMAVLYVESSAGHLDLLINNDAVPPARLAGPGLRERYFELFNTNVFGTASLTHAFVPLLRASTYERRRIVNVSSGLGSLANAESEGPEGAEKAPLHAVRAAAAALNMLTIVDAAQLKKDGIEVVSVCPGRTHASAPGGKALRDVKEGAATVVRAATAVGVSGRLVTDDTPEGFYPW